MGTNSAPLIADLFLFCCERDFMASLSYKKEAEIIQACNSTRRYLNDLLNIGAVVEWLRQLCYGAESSCIA